MKIIVALSAVLAVALAAPTRDSPFVNGVKRSKKSTYGSAPAYGALSSYGAGAAPCGSSQALAPVALYLAPQAAGPHYREDEGGLENEDEAPAARSYGGYGDGAGAGVGAGASGPGAVGVFPNARVGGCAVPLLLSCAPTVVSGHVVKHGYNSYAAPATAASYKEAEEKEAHTHEHAWAHAQRANDKRDELHQHHAAAMPQDHEQMPKKH